MTNTNDQQHGFLLVDKPAGMTSHDVIDVLRKVTGIRKIGHTGTLDPFATGLLLVGIGRDATKHMQDLVGQGKEYEATIVLGATTETLDTEGEIQKQENIPVIDLKSAKKSSKQFLGDIEQIPPMHSAIKVDGTPLYKLARAGKEVERKPRQVKIKNFEILDVDAVEDLYEVKAHITCSSGTYIRSLARDFAHALNTNGYLKQLRRTQIGPNKIINATPLADITTENWQSKLQKFQSVLVDENLSA